MDSRFRPLTIVGLLIILLLESCHGQASSKTLTINDWSGSWNFTGFGIGPSSGDYYHLLSSADLNQCAIFKETTSNVVAWAKLYSEYQCAGLALESSESNVQFATNEGTFGIVFLGASDGSLLTAIKDSTMNISGGISTISAVKSSGYTSFGGNMINSAGESCAGYTSFASTIYECSSNEIFLGAYMVGQVNCYFSRTTANGESHLRCFNISDSSNLWSTSINITSTSESIQKVATSSNDNYFYLAAESSTLGSILIAAFNMSDGSIVNSMRQRSSSKQLKIGSFVTPNSANSITYLSSYSSMDTYSELIKVYFPNSDYVIYQQQCINLRFQYIDTRETWIALQQTAHIHYAQIPSMGDVMDILTVTQLSNSGLEDVATSITTTTGYTLNPNSGSAISLPNEVRSDLNLTSSAFVAPTEGCQSNNSDDDSISTLSIVLINVCCLLAIIIVIGIVAAVIYSVKRAKNRNEGMSKVDKSDPPAEERSSLREENKA